MARFFDRYDTYQEAVPLRIPPDIEICSQQDQTIIKAHGLFLGQFLLDHKFLVQNEANTSKYTHSMSMLVQANRDVLSTFHEHLYGGPVHLEPITVWKVVQFAKKYQLKSLLHQCFDYLQAHITLTNCVHIFHSTLGSNHQIESTVGRFMRTHFRQIIDCPQFFELEFEVFKQLLEDDFLNVPSESAVWEVIVRWIEWKPNQRLNLLGELMRTIRFGRVSFDYISNTIGTNLMVTNNASNRQLVEQMLGAHSDLQNKRKDGYGLPAQSNIPSIRPRIPNQLVMMYGGWKDDSTTDSIETYDWQCNMWFESRMPGKLLRSYHGMEVLDGKVYIIGGSDGTLVLNTLICFNPVQRTCTKRCSMLDTRCFVTTAVCNGCIYALGGHNGMQRVKTCERYFPKKDVWLPIASMNIVRSDASATVFKNNIYVAGGLNHDSVENSVEVYDPQRDQWTLIEPMLSARTSFVLIAYHNRLYALGGNDGYERMSSCECYNFKLKVWSAAESMINARSTFKAVIVNEKLLVTGGYQNESTIGYSEIYDDSQCKWSPVKELNCKRSGFAMVTIEGLPKPNAEEYTFNGHKPRQTNDDHCQ